MINSLLLPRFARDLLVIKGTKIAEIKHGSNPVLLHQRLIFREM